MDAVSKFQKGGRWRLGISGCESWLDSISACASPIPSRYVFITVV